MKKAKNNKKGQWNITGRTAGPDEKHFAPEKAGQENLR